MFVHWLHDHDLATLNQASLMLPRVSRLPPTDADVVEPSSPAADPDWNALDQVREVRYNE